METKERSYRIKKRNGSDVPFNLDKIVVAITKAFEATRNAYQQSIVEWLAIRAVADAETKIKDGVLGVEDIQDSVEKILSDAGYADVAKSYILYRKQREKVRNIAGTVVNYKELVDNYLKVNDWRVKENSTVTYSVGGLILSNSGAVTANYWLSEVYDKEVADAHRNADIHLHDLSMLTGYCFTGDTRVKTLDGKNPTFKELVDKNTKEIWVYAYDTEKNCIVPAKAVLPRKTRTVDKLMEIKMCDGTIIRSTVDHPFMMRDGSFKPAKELRANMSLMPLYIGENSKYVGIHPLWNTEHKKVYVHRWVMENIIGRPLKDNEVIHHKNGDKHDNRPENLEIMEDTAHRSMEIRETMRKDIWKKNNAQRLAQYNRSSDKRNQVSVYANSRVRNKNGRFATVFQYQQEFDSNCVAYNHQIRKTQEIILENPVDVYDLTVPGYENFAIQGNVFVHNCAGWSLKQLIQEGLGGVEGRITSKPANHLSTLCNQMVNFLGIMQNEWAGKNI